MANEFLCRECRAYTCRSDDAWCGYCGSPCAQIAVELNPEVVHVKEKPSRIFVKVSNLSCAALRVEQVHFPDWLRPRDTIDRESGIAPGESLKSFAEITGRIETPTSGLIEFVTQCGSGSARLLVIEQAPSIVCEPDHLSVWTAPNGHHSRASVKIRPESGSLRILAIRPSGANVTLRPAIEPSGRLVSEGEALELEVSPIAAAVNLETRISRATLKVDYKGPHGLATATAVLDLAPCRPPQLRWTGEMSQPEVRYQTSGQRLRFEFRNQNPDGKDSGLQNGILVIHSVELSADSLPGVSALRKTDLPPELTGGAATTVDFEVDFSAMRGKPAQLASLRLKVTTNHLSLERDVTVKVEPMQAYGGLVAIDFGSSNSCCAIWQQGEEIALLPLDENDALVSPTVVRYLTLETDPPGIETGQRVKRLAAEYAEVAASTADRLKQRLGDIEQQITLRPEVEAHWVERNASEAASDYLRSVRQTAETARGMLFQSFILTHPARCSLRQYARLREALSQAFGAEGNQIRFLQEPIAALVGFLVERARLHPQRDYTVASFDLGGGTTDIALVQVRYDAGRADRLRIIPHILYCRGERFGGEDLTDFLVNELAIRSQFHLFAIGGAAGATLIGEGVTGAAELDIRRNRAEFRRAAEQFKASLSVEAQTRKISEPEFLELRILEQGQTTTRRISFKQISGALNNWGRLVTKFLDHARSEVGQRADLLLRAVEITGQKLDVIQLSGKTAYLEVAAEAVASRFPGVEIERASQPKECVVKGACLSQSLRRGNVVVELSTDDQRMTSTIGGFDLYHPHFQPILRVDQVIPTEGIVGDLPLAWDGNEAFVLWEDLDGADRLISEAEASRDLQRLGTWIPDKQLRVESGKWWTIRVRLRDFRLSVEAVDPQGKVVRFHALNSSDLIADDSVSAPRAAMSNGQPAYDASTRQAIEDYNRSLDMSGAEAANWFFSKYQDTIRISQIDADEQHEPEAVTRFKVDPRGNLVTITSDAAHLLLVPMIGYDLGRYRNSIDGVFQFPEGKGRLRLHDPAVISREGRNTFAMERPGSFVESA